MDGGQQPKRLGLGAAFFVLPGQIDCLRGRCLGFSKVTGQKDCFRQCRERKCVSGSRFGKGVAGNRRFEERESLSDLPDTGLGATEGSHDLRIVGVKIVSCAQIEQMAEHLNGIRGSSAN